MTQTSTTVRAGFRLMAVLMASVLMTAVLVVAGGLLRVPAASAAPTAGDQCENLKVKSLTGPTQVSAGTVAMYAVTIENPNIDGECDSGVDVQIKIAKTVPGFDIVIDADPALSCLSEPVQGGASQFSAIVRCVGVTFGLRATTTITLSVQFVAGQPLMHAEVDRLDEKDANRVVTANQFRQLTVNVAAASAQAPSAPAPAPSPKPQAASAFPTVKIGDSGEPVTTIQHLLRHHGVGQGKDIVIDGDFGEQTKAAVSDFQKGKGLTANGVVGPQTWQALIVSVKQGSQGDAVRAVQSQLVAQGAEIAIDGDFGVQTDAAVRAFQEDKKLTIDGLVGPQTWAALVDVKT